MLKIEFVQKKETSNWRGCVGEFGVRVDHGGFGSRGISLPVGLGGGVRDAGGAARKGDEDVECRGRGDEAFWE